MEKNLVFTGRCSELYATLDPELSLWRMCQLSLFEEDSQLLEVLPQQGIAQNGELYQLSSLELPILGNAGSVYPTPTATPAGKIEIDKSRIDPEKGINQRFYTKKGTHTQRTLERLAQWGMLPTPAAHEARLGYQRRPEGKKGKQKSLTTVVIDQMGGREKVTGQLNPEFVEWLMGFPIGHTDLEP